MTGVLSGPVTGPDYETQTQSTEYIVAAINNMRAEFNDDLRNVLSKWRRLSYILNI